MTGFEERRLRPCSVDGDQLIAPAVISFQGAQLRPGRGRSRRQMIRTACGQFGSSSSPCEVRSSQVSSTTPASSR
jgi:hypothetical protein